MASLRGAAGARSAPRSRGGIRPAAARASGATWRGRGAHGSKPVDRSTASYQCFAQIPSVGRRPGGQCSIALVEGDADARAEPRQHAARILQHVLGVEHGRRCLRCAPARRGRSRPAAAARCRAAPAGTIFASEAGSISAGCADQEGVGEAEHPVAAHVRQPVVGHVLLVVDGAAVRNRPDQPGHHALPVAVVMLDHLVDARVRDGHLRQVVSVEGLVHTQASGRFPKARISAVEMLRGPDHIAMRTASTLHTAATARPRGATRRCGRAGRCARPAS